MKDYYAVLGVAPDADHDVIAAAHKALAKKLHPDGKSGAERSRCEARLKEVNEAWAVLRDPEKRQRYDRQCGTGHRGASAQQDPAEAQRSAEDIDGFLEKGAKALRAGADAFQQFRGVVKTLRTWSK